MDKSFIKKEFVLPLIISIVAVAVSLLSLGVFVKGQYFFKNEINFASLAIADARTVQSGEGNPRELVRNDTVIGSVRVGSTELPLVFSPDYADMKGSFCQLDNGVLISEIGNAVLYCTKESGSDVRSLSVGDTVYVKAFYGDYSYRVIGIDSLVGDVSAQSLDVGTGRGLTIYTPKSDRVGLNREYTVVSCELASGTPLAEQEAE